MMALADTDAAAELSGLTLSEARKAKILVVYLVSGIAVVLLIVTLIVTTAKSDSSKNA